ncbi:MAG: TatD family hydrolase [Bacteroidales bacterium]|nr:TatD family hydrolase [Bacteroidales bacterium]
MIDTHTHLYLPEFADEAGGGASAVRRAMAAGVDRMIFPNVDLGTIEPMERLADEFPGVVFKAMGLHPTEVSDDWQPALDSVMSRLGDGSGYVAVGEIGIDLYWDATYRVSQMQAFDRQVRRAVELDLPVIIHCRNGLDETLEVLSDVSGVRGVFHSFGGDVDDVDRIHRVGDFYFGINGIVTFKNSKLRDVLGHIGLERLLLETDSPYLAPVPKRGRRNESAYLPYICAHIAQSLGVASSEIERVTSDNAVRLFDL